GAGSPAANDTDVDGDSLSVSAVSNPLHGTVSIVSGEIRFVPAANYCGTAASFDYTVSDGALTDTGTVTLNVACVNDAPVASASPETQSGVQYSDPIQPVTITVTNDVDSPAGAISASISGWKKSSDLNFATTQ